MTAGVISVPIANAAPSIPRTTTRRGPRPSARPSSSASATPTACVEASRRSRGSGPSSRVDAMERPGGCAGAHGVDHDERVELVPRVEKPRRLVRAVEDDGPRSTKALGRDRGRPRRRRGTRLPRQTAAALRAARPRGAGSASRTRCTGRSCGSSARSRCASSSSGRSSELPTTPMRSSSIVFWFCEVGGTIFASRIVPVVVELVAVPADPARRLGAAVADAARGAHSTAGASGRLVALDDAERLVGRVQRSRRARTTMLRNGLRQTGPRPASSAASLRDVARARRS